MDVPHFTVLCRHLCSLQIEGLWQPCIEQVYQHHSPTAFAHFMSLSYILVILEIFQTFSSLLYLLWWSVISDLWCYYCKKITTCWRLRWWSAFFSNKIFFLFLFLKNIYLFVWLCWVLLVACRIFQLWHVGLNPGPLHWDRGVLATGPPSKSLFFFF